MGKTSIEWTARPGTVGRTWNPARGCEKVSPGCKNCYAERIAARFRDGAFKGFVDGRGRWTGKMALLPDVLVAPLSWRAPATCFVNSMTDLFGEGLRDEEIAAVFGVMAATPQHTYIVLTKRAARMREWFIAWLPSRIAASRAVFPDDPDGWVARHLVTNRARHFGAPSKVQAGGNDWPLSNVWLGVSVEDQAAADARIPELLATPAAVRFVSYEPALGPVDFRAWLNPPGMASLFGEALPPTLDWLIVGGESGPGARPFALEWAERTVAACRVAEVPCFVKQLGAHVVSEERMDGDRWAWRARLRDRKGGDMSEFPENLRVREFPR